MKFMDGKENNAINKHVKMMKAYSSFSDILTHGPLGDMAIILKS